MLVTLRFFVHFLVHFREAGVSWSVAGWFFFGEAFGVFVPEAFYFGFYFFVQPQHAQEVGDGHECNGDFVWHETPAKVFFLAIPSLLAALRLRWKCGAF